MNEFMKTLFLFLWMGCLAPLCCYAQINVSVSYNETENKIEVRISNDTTEDIVVSDFAQKMTAGSRIYISYSMTKDNFASGNTYWIPLRDTSPSFITLKGGENLCVTHKPTTHRTLDKNFIFMKVDYCIIYYTVSDRTCHWLRGEIIYDIDTRKWNR